MTEGPAPAGLFIFLDYLDLLRSSPLEVGCCAYFMKLSKGRVRLWANRNPPKCWSYRFPLDFLVRCWWALPFFQWLKTLKSLFYLVGRFCLVWEH